MGEARRFIFATNNDHKVAEIRAALGQAFILETMREAGLDIDIPEPHPTLEANALEKASTVLRLTGQDCFAEDTGLEVGALGGLPGVRSARYAGEGRSDAANIQKLLHALESKSDRSAQFRTVMALFIKDKAYVFEGICKGQITLKPSGEGGFGYDPVFVPQGAAHTFAEMGLSEKNEYSHRKNALDQLIDFLKKLPNGEDKG
jgi:XTP/dITP diphosphohydrolase